MRPWQTLRVVRACCSAASIQRTVPARSKGCLRTAFRHAVFRDEYMAPENQMEANMTAVELRLYTM